MHVKDEISLLDE